MAITNTSKPTTSQTNVSRAFDYGTWASITTTWATETRTWAGTGTLFTNTAKRLLGSYTFDEMGTFTDDQIGNLTFNDPFTPIINTSKP